MMVDWTCFLLIAQCAGADAAPAARQTTAQPRQVYDLMPLTLGRNVLSSWAWTNHSHPPHDEELWRDGKGIGAPEAFIGLPDRVCAFAVHAESRGGDFVNYLAEGSDPGMFSCALTLLCVCVTRLYHHHSNTTTPMHSTRNVYACWCTAQTCRGA